MRMRKALLWRSLFLAVVLAVGGFTNTAGARADDTNWEMGLQGG